MVNKWAILAAGMLGTLPAWAFESFIIQDVEIVGLERISEGTVLNYLPVQIGDRFEAAQSAQVLKDLYATGFFENIELAKEQKSLVITVTERAAIGKISVSGNEAIKEEELLKNLKEAGLAAGRTFDRSILERMRLELEQMYFSHGKYGVEIDIQEDVQPRNRVNISITIQEGSAARIKSINIVGNEAFSDAQLKKKMSLASSNVMSWFSKKDQYAKQKLGQDLETLRSFYLDRGYLNFKIVSTQVSITPDKQDIYITINLDEGVPYTVKGFSLSGQLPIDASELTALIDLQEGEIFSRTKVSEIVTQMSNRLGDEGYSFAKINPVPELDEEHHQVHIQFYVDPAARVYVRRIDFEGNLKTQDQVLRREMTQLEGAWVSTKQVELSKAKLNRTGYFNDVKVETRPVPGSLDEVDLKVKVDEASSGQLGGGIGYSDVDKFLINANVSNRNFLGTGKSVDFAFNRSRAYTTYNLGYLNPYYTINGISRGFNVYYSETELSESTSIANYTTDALGGNLHYGIPLTDYQRVTIGIGVNSTKIAVQRVMGIPDVSVVPFEISKFLSDNGARNNAISLAMGWNYNSLDRYIFPENGWKHSTSATVALPGSDLQYYRLTHNTQMYKSLGHGYIFTFTGVLGYGDGYGKTDGLPFYKNFFAGGSRTVRGFDESSLGPRDSLNNPFGGNFMAAASLGLVVPNYFSPETKSVRFSLFIDGGQVYDLGHNQKVDFLGEPVSRNPKGLRYSVGASLTWMSPLAPLVFSFAKPINADEFDRVKKFSFNFGTVF